MMGETLVIPVLEAKLILTAMEGSAWDKPDPSQKTLQEKQTAASSLPCPVALLQLWAWPGTISFWPMSPGANF